MWKSKYMIYLFFIILYIERMYVVGHELWTRLCGEHGISEDGTLHSYVTEGHDKKDVFFYKAS
jgi:hypothetical protein